MKPKEREFPLSSTIVEIPWLPDLFFSFLLFTFNNNNIYQKMHASKLLRWLKALKIIVYYLFSLFSQVVFFSSLDMFEMALVIAVSKKKKFYWKIFTLVVVKLSWYKIQELPLSCSHFTSWAGAPICEVSASWFPLKVIAFLCLCVTNIFLPR